MELVEFVKALAIVVGGGFALALIRLGYQILSADREDYKKNQQAGPKIIDPMLGTLNTYNVCSRDYLVGAGLAFNENLNQWQEQGALSESAIDTILKTK